MIKTVKSIFFLLFFSVCISCNTNRSSIDYLQKVLDNLEKIESATYFEYKESWQHGDTTAMSIFCEFIKEYNNPVDTTIGAAYINFDCEDITKMEFGYDGDMRVLIYHDYQKIVFDNFTARPLPFRPLSPPFFNYTKNIILYTLTTKDSIDWSLTDFNDHYYLKLTIQEDKQVEFFGKAHYMPDNPYIFGETTSIYELWIAKSDNRPYKVRREMSHDISVSTCSKVEINTLNLDEFSIYDYLPDGYEAKAYGENNREDNVSNLIGEKAPLWILNDKDEQKVSLSGFDGKILLLQFTGIGCGPCQASIPFLKEIKEKYDKDTFDLIAIETWMRKPHSLQNYSKKNELNYSLLSGTDDVVKDYQTGGAAPVFFIIDREQIIRKVIIGYSEEGTGKEIIEAINELL